MRAPYLSSGWDTENSSRSAINLGISVSAISHLVKIRMTDGSPINDATVLCGNDGEIGYLESVMETAYESNKKVLPSLLNDDMVNKIGLKD